MKKIIAFTLMGLMCGCSVLKKKTPPPCPSILVERDTVHATYFKDDTGRDLTDHVLDVDFMGYRGACEYDLSKGLLYVSLLVEVDGKIGSAAKTRKLPFSYFVAMPSFYPNDKAKQIFTPTLDFPNGVDVVRYRDDEISLTIPLVKKDPSKKSSSPDDDSKFDDKANYDIYIGLQLDKGMLDYNRKMREMGAVKAQQ